MKFRAGSSNYVNASAVNVQARWAEEALQGEGREKEGEADGNRRRGVGREGRENLVKHKV